MSCLNESVVTAKVAENLQNKWKIMSNTQAPSFLASCLPDDEELIQREKTWLNIFDKFSIDEGPDAELDEESELDSNIMSNDVHSSDSDISIVSNGEDNDSDYDMQKLADEIKPTINERIAAWQEKGIHLALQTFDPKVAVEMWLQANNECETTTKTVTKMVIKENGKTTCKETRRTTTTTKAFRTIVRPHLIINNHQNQIDNEMQPVTSVTPNSNDKASTIDDALHGNGSTHLKQTPSSKPSIDEALDGNGSTHLQKTPNSKEFSFKKPSAGIPSIDEALDGNGSTHLQQTPNSKEFSFKKPSAGIPTMYVSDRQLRPRRVPKDKSRSSPKRVHQNKIEKTTKAKNRKQKSHVVEIVSPLIEQQTDCTTNSNPSLQIVVHSPDRKEIRETNMLATNRDPQKFIDGNNLRISDENTVPNAGMLINSRIDPPRINAIQSFDSNNSDSEEDILMTCYRGPKSVVLYEPPTRNAIQSFNFNNSDSEEDDILMTSYKNLNCFMIVKS